MRILIVNPHKQAIFVKLFDQLNSPVGGVLGDSFRPIADEFSLVHGVIVYHKALLKTFSF